MTEERPATILIVEDDPGMARLQECCLERAGFSVRLAATADEALAALRLGGIDLAVLDYKLSSGMTGLDLHTRMKEAGLDVPVIMVTGFSEQTTVVQALRAGVRDFVSKSSEYLDYLPEAARRVLHNTQLERRLAESEARLAGIVYSAKDAILTTDANWNITLFNPAAERMFRCPAAGALGRPFRQFIPRTLQSLPGRPEDAAPESMTHTSRTCSTSFARWVDRVPEGPAESA